MSSYLLNGDTHHRILSMAHKYIDAFVPVYRSTSYESKDCHEQYNTKLWQGSSGLAATLDTAYYFDYILVLGAFVRLICSYRWVSARKTFFCTNPSIFFKIASRLKLTLRKTSFVILVTGQYTIFNFKLTPWQYITLDDFLTDVL